MNPDGVRRTRVARLGRMLDGVGDPDTGEWNNRRMSAHGDRVVHRRRRLTADEEQVTGPVRDIRDTPQHRERVQAVADAYKKVATLSVSELMSVDTLMTLEAAAAL